MALCQGKVESSAFQQSRKFRVSIADCRSHGRLRCPREKRAFLRDKGRGIGVGLDRIGANSLVAMENPGSHSGSLESFPVQGDLWLLANFVPEAAHQWSVAAMYGLGFFL